MIPAKYWSPTKKLMVLGAMAGGKLVKDTATGNPLTFTTDIAKPLKSLLIPFTPQQEGSGDPSPENIRSILPWNGLSVFGGGKNLLNPVAENSIPFQDSSYSEYTLTDGVVVTSGRTLFGFKAKVKPNTVYRFTFDTTEAITMEIFAYTEEPTVIKNDDRQIININSSTWQFTTFSDTEWISCGIYTSKADVTVKDFRLTAGSAQEAYVPYVPITETDIVFPSPVYGGTLDVVSGVLTVEWGRYDLGQLSWELKSNGNNYWFYSGNVPELKIISDSSILSSIMCERYKTVRGAYIYNGSAGDNVVGQDGDVPRIRIRDDSYNNDADAFKTAMSGVYLYFELAEPQTVTLTPAQITALVGDNTIWSDADGSMTATYLKKA